MINLFEIEQERNALQIELEKLLETESMKSASVIAIPSRQNEILYRLGVL